MQDAVPPGTYPTNVNTPVVSCRFEARSRDDCGIESRDDCGIESQELAIESEHPPYAHSLLSISCPSAALPVSEQLSKAALPISSCTPFLSWHSPMFACPFPSLYLPACCLLPTSLPALLTRLAAAEHTNSYSSGRNPQLRAPCPKPPNSQLSSTLTPLDTTLKNLDVETVRHQPLETSTSKSHNPTILQPIDLSPHLSFTPQP